MLLSLHSLQVLVSYVFVVHCLTDIALRLSTNTSYLISTLVGINIFCSASAQRHLKRRVFSLTVSSGRAVCGASRTLSGRRPSLELSPRDACCCSTTPPTTTDQTTRPHQARPPQQRAPQALGSAGWWCVRTAVGGWWTAVHAKRRHKIKKWRQLEK